MKIAICFSGHLRNFYEDQIDQLQESIKLLHSSGHSADCFFSIWDTYHTTKGYTRHSASSSTGEKVDVGRLESLGVKGLSIENFESLKHKFLLKDLHPTISPEVSTILSEDGLLYSTPMFYKIYRCNLLKSDYEQLHNFKYDLVVRYRSNIDLVDPLNFDHVHTNTWYNAGNGNPYSRGLNYTHESLMTQDIFFYGDSKTMDTICNLYPNLSRLIHNHGSTGPERLLYDWCFLENKLNHEISPIKFTYK